MAVGVAEANVAVPLAIENTKSVTSRSPDPLLAL